MHPSFYISITYTFSRHPRACPGHPRLPDAAFISRIRVMRPDVDPRDKPGDDGHLFHKLMERIALDRCENPLAHWGRERSERIPPPRQPERRRKGLFSFW